MTVVRHSGTCAPDSGPHAPQAFVWLLLAMALMCSMLVVACRTDSLPSRRDPASPARPLLPILSDDFERPDGPLVPGAAPSGQAWMTGGFLSVPPVILEGRLTGPPGAAYARVDLGKAPSRMTGLLSWSDGQGGIPVVAMATSSVGFDPPSDLLHLVIGLEQWALQVRERNGDLVTLALRTYPRMRTDGTGYEISMTVEDATATVVGPDGVEVSHTDPRIAQLHGRYLFWETLYKPGEPYPRWESVSAEGNP